MPSTQLFPQSGGIVIASGQYFSGVINPQGGIQLKLADSAPGVVYVGLPPPTQWSGFTSGIALTITSGGSMTSGGLTDGFEMGPGDAYFVPKIRMTSGIESIRVSLPAASSGARLFWEPF